jgi:hypothetical protein
MADEAVTSEQVRPRKGTKDAREVFTGPPPEEDTDVAGRNSPEDAVKAIQDLAREQEKKMKEEQTKRVLEQAGTPGKVLMKMERRNSSWTTRSNVVFTQEHPFQLVPEEEVAELIAEGGFRRADPMEVVHFYGAGG